MQQIQIRDNIYTTSETINAIICVCTVSPKAVVTVRPDERVSPKAVVTVRPDERVFRGETVTLRCDIKWAGDTDTEWTYRWEIEGTNDRYKNTVSRTSTQELIISSVDLFHSGEYTCTGLIHTLSSQRSDAVTLTVSGECVCV